MKPQPVRWVFPWLFDDYVKLVVTNVLLCFLSTPTRTRQRVWIPWRNNTNKKAPQT